MTPGIKVVESAGVAHKVHTYEHDPKYESYGAEAAEKMGVSESRVFKTLVVQVDTEFAVAVIPVMSALIMKRVAMAAAGKKAKMATPGDAERLTGYVLGGISPVGQKRQLMTLIDESATEYSSIFVSAGRRGLEIELDPSDLRAITNGSFVSLC